MYFFTFVIEQEEPYESRGSRTVLWEHRGETPLCDPTGRYFHNYFAMGLFSFFKKKPPFHDPFFGELRYQIVKDCTWFEGQKWFAPVEKDVGLLVDADAVGPTETQHNFYLALEHGYFTLVDKIKPVLEDEFRNWKEDFVIQDFSKEFTLDHLRVPRQDITPVKWEMVFTTVHDLNHYFTVEFEGMEPKGVIIDG